MSDFGVGPYQFDDSASDDQIADAVRIAVAVPQGFGRNSPPVDADLLGATMRRLCVPTSSMISSLRRLLEVTKGHEATYFPTTQRYWQRVYELSPTTQPAICLTGLAGTGKSVLLNAFHRLTEHVIARNTNFAVDIQLEPCWMQSLTALDDLKASMRALSMRGEAQGSDDASLISRRGTVAEFANAASRRSRVLGACVIVLDETQFESLSQGATARLAKKLLTFWALGPRLIFCVNYSMARGLLRRNNEERDRLMSDPLLIQPDSAQSEDWHKTVAADLAVAPQAFSINAESSSELLHRYTFGIKRKLVDLLTASYLEARRSGRSSVEEGDLLSAYRSQKYTVHREDVESLWAHQIDGSSRRSDLVCPYPNLQDSALPSLAAKKSLKREVAQRSLLSYLTPQEKAAVKADLSPLDAKPLKKGNVIRMKRATKDDLIASGRDFFGTDEP